MASGGTPNWVWIFTPVVVLGFVGFLFYLSTVPAGDDIDKITQSLSTQLSAQPQADKPNQPDAAPPPNKVEEYEFFKLLENKEVAVPEVKEYKSTPKGVDKDGKKFAYRLRAGAFSTQQGADRLKAMLTLNGMDTQIEQADVNGKTYFRVFVGPYDNRSKMNKAQDILVSMNIQPMVVKQTLE